MSEFIRYLKNGRRILKSPEMAGHYIKWALSENLMSRAPTAIFYEDIKFGEFVTFSEYWNRRRGIEAEDLMIIEACYRVSGSLSLAPSVAVDVGGNIGLFGLALAKAGYLKVHVFEPVPETYRRLEANLSRNHQLSKRIIINRLGLSSCDGEVEFMTASKSPEQNKIAHRLSGTHNYDGRIRCDVSTLDAYISRNGIEQVEFLKLDVEGFEASVLKGGAAALKRGAVRFVYSEIIPHALEEAASSVNELWEILRSAGFDPVHLDDRQGRFIKVSLEKALELAGSRRNVLFQKS